MVFYGLPERIEIGGYGGSSSNIRPVVSGACATDGALLPRLLPDCLAG